MTNEVSLFDNNPLANSDLFKSLQDMNKELIGTDGGQYRRISIKGGKFREILNGEQVRVSKNDAMNVVIVGVAPIARTYFEGTYDPHADAVPPVCWSADTDNPAPEVANPQASRCADCPQNIKGSGQGNSRACRFSQRLAVVIESDLETVYQLQIPATSIFGDPKGNHTPMRGYARLLDAHDTPVIAVVTEMIFDEDSEVPKLMFRPLRPLAEDELNTVVGLMDSEEVRDAITFTVSQTDGVQEPPAANDAGAGDDKVKDLFPDGEKPAKQKGRKPRPKAEAPVEEPVKVVKKTAAAAPEEKPDLSSMVDAWDDE